MIPHFCKARFAVSGADAVPKPQLRTQEVSLTARLQAQKSVVDAGRYQCTSEYEVGTTKSVLQQAWIF